MSRQPAGKLADVSGKNVSISPEQHYDDWADSYDDDLLGEYGYCAHRIAAGLLSAALNDHAASILDVGCGTGLVGAELARLGFTSIDGIDISSGMLSRAATLNVYQQLTQLDVESAETVTQRYDAVISAGCFGLGHMGPGGLRSISRYAKADVPIVVFMNAEPFVDMDFQSTIDRLISS